MVIKYINKLDDCEDIKFELGMSKDIRSSINIYANSLYGNYKTTVYNDGEYCDDEMRGKFIRNVVESIIDTSDIDVADNISGVLYADTHHDKEVIITFELSGNRYKKLCEIARSKDISVNTLILNHTLYTMFIFNPITL